MSDHNTELEANGVSGVHPLTSNIHSLPSHEMDPSHGYTQIVKDSVSNKTNFLQVSESHKTSKVTKRNEIEQ